jgi:membrane fusion protein (multidrug efflux system)
MRTVLMISIAAAGLAAAGCQAPKAQNQPAAAVEPPPVTVSLVTVAAEPFVGSVPVTGTLVSPARVDIKAETIGRITRFDKQEGESVTAGEAVVWVNDENYRLSLRQSQTALKVLEAALERARLLEQHSRSELERAGNLVKSGGITDKDLKAAQIAQLDAKAQVAVAEAQCEDARSAIEVARKRLTDAVIYTPVSGVIQKKFVNKGAYVEAPTALFTVVDNGTLELESPVAAADLGAIRSNQAVSFSVNSYPGVKFEGSVVEIAPEVEVETRSAKVRIRTANPGGKLKAGMFAEGEIRTGTLAQAVVVPSAAVYRDDRSAKSSYVFVVEGGKAARRAVRIGRERDGKLEIVEGLKAGDTLISEQSIEIAEGVRVQARS